MQAVPTKFLNYVAIQVEQVLILSLSEHVKQVGWHK